MSVPQNETPKHYSPIHRFLSVVQISCSRGSLHEHEMNYAEAGISNIRNMAVPCKRRRLI